MNDPVDHCGGDSQVTEYAAPSGEGLFFVMIGDACS